MTCKESCHKNKRQTGCMLTFGVLAYHYAISGIKVGLIYKTCAYYAKFANRLQVKNGK